ncbi:3-oxoacyl-ACP synthase [Euzebyella marina]|uniref:3-oxoacyl-ACP synthase n=1 Tax=Euzebyella marina TaxID=1761453 RepID=A0A3G2L153_9FLAO|nr:3-oxoacyl-ACP synthase [Euzebyella marina]AYN65988.1 3-oxoacyl-ACP synthase [Euzebyella marina]
MNQKQELYNFCLDFVDGRISRIQTNIGEIQDSLQSETKSTAGDKHETGRAMLQIEREKLGQQLAEAEQMKAVLKRANPSINSKVVGLGSLVRTDLNSYYVAISAGKCELSESPVFCISAMTPIGRLLMGKHTGETFVFNGATQKILEIQ